MPDSQLPGVNRAGAAPPRPCRRSSRKFDAFQATLFVRQVFRGDLHRSDLCRKGRQERHRRGESMGGTAGRIATIRAPCPGETVPGEPCAPAFAAPGWRRFPQPAGGPGPEGGRSAGSSARRASPSAPEAAPRAVPRGVLRAVPSRRPSRVASRAIWSRHLIIVSSSMGASSRFIPSGIIAPGNVLWATPQNHAWRVRRNPDSPGSSRLLRSWYRSGRASRDSLLSTRKRAAVGLRSSSGRSRSNRRSSNRRYVSRGRYRLRSLETGSKRLSRRRGARQRLLPHGHEAV